MSQFILFFLICFILSKDDYIDSYFHLDNKLEYQLIEYAIKKKIKLIGICRGMQVINIFFKGLYFFISIISINLIDIPR